MITVTRLRNDAMAHRVDAGGHSFVVDIPVADGGGDEGPDPHDLYDAALGACKATTMVWYANRKGLALRDVEVTVERDASQERAGVYKLAVRIRIDGDLTEAERVQLLGAAQKCPIHKLMTAVETVVTTELV
jgi:putative redox protein